MVFFRSCVDGTLLTYWVLFTSRQAQISLERASVLRNAWKHTWDRFRASAQMHNGMAAKQGSCVHWSSPCNDILAACQEGHLDKALELLLSSEPQTVVSSADLYKRILKLCSRTGALAHAKRVSAHLLSQGGASSVGEQIVTTLVKCGGFGDALEVFHKLREKTVLSWTAIISGYASRGQGQEALRLYQAMQEEGVQPNTYTFVILLKACGSIPDLQAGKRLHGEIMQYGCQSNVFVGNCLVDMYGKCGSVRDAEYAFTKLVDKSVVSWNVMLSAYAQHSQGKMAWQLYERMQELGMSPNDRTFVTVLLVLGMLATTGKSPVKEESRSARLLEKGKEIHSYVFKKGYSEDVFVASSLINMYGKCGSSLDARMVFDRLLEPNLVSWNAMLAAYVELSQGEQALQLYQQMQWEGPSPDGWTFVSALQACNKIAENEEVVIVCGRSTKIRALQESKVLHAYAWRKGYTSDVFVGNTLVSLYGKCGSNVDRDIAFQELPHKDNVSWNAILAACAEQGEAESVLNLYSQMLVECRSPDVWTFVSALQACGILAEEEHAAVLDGESAKLLSLGKGKVIHSALEMKGYCLDTLVGNCLVSMYGKCGKFADAQHVFGRMPQRDIVTWNAMIAALVQQNQAEKALRLYEELQEECLSPNARTFVVAIQACVILAHEQTDLTLNGVDMKLEILQQGRAIHAEAHRKGYASDVFVASNLISMYGTCGSLADSYTVFCGLSQLNTTMSWNSLLSQCFQSGHAERCILLYRNMMEDGVSPNVRTFVSSLSACGLLAEQEESAAFAEGLPTKLQSLVKVKAIHSEIRRRCLNLDGCVLVSSALIRTYGKCGSIVDAKNVFDAMSEQDVVSWTSMLAAYVEQGHPKKAFELYEQMREEGTSPDDRTIASVLLACGAAAELEEHVVDKNYTKSNCLGKGKVLHAEAQVRGFVADLFVGNTLIAMYAKCGDVVDAYVLFQWMPERNVVSWTAMLVAYLEHGQAEEALELYKKMELEGPTPNDITHVCVIQACVQSGSLDFLRHIHLSLSSGRSQLSPVIAGTLVNAYAKCATMADAQSIFDALPQPDVVSWTALIAGYAHEGDTATALTCFEKMQLVGVQPNRVTFVAVLSACSHAGMVDKGVEYFESMSTKYGLTPQAEHYASILDLLGRAGCFEMLHDLISSMPVEPTPAMWLCLLGACRKHGMVTLGEHAFKCVTRIQPQHAAAYVLMSNIYADAGKLVFARHASLLMRDEGARKMPGQSWIDHGQKSHSFMVEDRNHVQHAEVYDLLRNLKQTTCLRISPDDAFELASADIGETSECFAACYIVLIVVSTEWAYPHRKLGM